MSKKAELVSVIVPIYNVEKYLDKCIKSILNQTYKHLDIILVDDGSPDNCSKICDNYALKDKRIRVFHKKNGGLSDARNYGLQQVDGKYVCFVDSDDYIDENYIEKLLQNLQKNDADICACSFWYVDEQGNMWQTRQKENKIYSSKDAILDIFTARQETEVMVWNKIYKTSLFKDHNIEFPCGKINEDNFTTYKLYDNAKKIVLIDEKLYYYLQRQGSIMSDFNSKRFDVLDAVEETKKYFAGRDEFKDSVICNEFLINFALLNNMIASDYNGNEKKIIIRNIKKNKEIFLKNKLITKKQKILIRLLCFSEYFYSLLLKIKKR